MATKKKPAAAKTPAEALQPKAARKVVPLPAPETFMQVEKWEGKTWRGQKYRIRITDTRNGQTLFQGESYADQRDRDALFDRCVALGMRGLAII